MPSRRETRARRRPDAPIAGGATRQASIGLGFAGALGLATCAHGPYRSATPPPPPEVVFNRTDAAAVSGMIANQCRTMGWAVDGARADSVTCTASVTTPQRILGALTMRNSNRQTRMASYHFMLSGAGSDVRVRTETWFSDPDRGQRRELKSGQAAKVGRQMIGFLVLMGGHLSRPADEPGAEP